MAPAQSQQQYLEGSPLDADIYAVLILAAIIVLVARRRPVISLSQRNWPILLFVLYCAVSITWSDYPDVALKRWIKSLGDYAMILILLTERDPTRAIKQVLARVGFILIPVSILLIKYYPEWGRAYALHWESTQFFTGVTDNKNQLGMVCLVFGFYAYWRVLEAWRERTRNWGKSLVVHGAIIAMAVWLLQLCDSKTSLSCLVLTIGLITAHAFWKMARSRAVLHVLVLAVISICFSVLFLGIGSDALQTIGRNSTLTGRTDIWKILLTVPINPVVGTGFESFWLGKRLDYLWSFPIVDGLVQAHDGYFDLYLNLGWLGVCFVGMLLWRGYRNVIRGLEQNPAMGRLRLGYIVIFLIYNFTEAAIRTSDLVWIGFLLAIASVPQASENGPLYQRFRAVRAASPLLEPRPVLLRPSECNQAHRGALRTSTCVEKGNTCGRKDMGPAFRKYAPPCICVLAGRV